MYNNLLGFIGLFFILIYIYRLNNKNYINKQNKFYLNNDNFNNYFNNNFNNNFNDHFIEPEINYSVLSNRKITNKMCKYC